MGTDPVFPRQEKRGLSPFSPVGILLAAGRAERFGGDKLLARLTAAQPGADSVSVGEAACRNLRAAMPVVVAVVRSGDDRLAAVLGAAGAQVIRCANADDGMGASLACGVGATGDAAGWVVALADMPWIRPETIARVAAAIVQGAVVAAPFHQGERGHPVGFGKSCGAMLIALGGDEGARSVLAAHRQQMTRIDVDDPGVVRDIDIPSDLAGSG